MTAARALLHDDVGLRLPLDGVRLIEASAGTGKTFTLATIYLRALVERQRRVSEVLVVTFTDAATAELHGRLRERLALAIEELEQAVRQGTKAIADDADADTERRLIRSSLRAALEATDADALSRHLSLCLLDLDQAPISTLHAFCQRSLSEHAFAGGRALDPGELDGDDGQRLLEVCDELWRRIALEGDWRADALTSLWTSPEKMARSLGSLLAEPAEVRLGPSPSTASHSATAQAERDAAFDALRDFPRGEIDRARELLDSALCDLKGNIYNAEKIRVAFAALATLRHSAAQPLELPDRLPLLGQNKIETGTKTAASNVGRIPRHPLFIVVDRLQSAIESLGQARRDDAIRLLHQLRAQADERLKQLKAQRRVRSFDDLIDDMAAALSDPRRGARLAEAIRKTHPLALIDEFQDTDARQWDIFRRLYVDQPEVALVLVGDPKQAIYRFRSGDIHTYLRASQSACEPFRLASNFRSRPSLIEACNAVFGGADGDAFRHPGIDYVDIHAGGKIDDDALLIDGVAPIAMQLWSPPAGDGRTPTKQQLERLALDATVADIVDWLNASTDGRVQVREKQTQRDLRPGDLAVLVSTGRQASRVQNALIERGVAAVCAGQDSLFSSDEANEVLRLLRALLRRGDGRALRAALATELIGLDADAIAALDRDDGSEFDIGALDLWRRRWEQHGAVALLEPLLIEAAPRLLGQRGGERMLANYRHLAEWLDEVRRRSHEAGDQLRTLERQIGQANDRDDSQQTRLESDRERVQILTVHKSKGLEFGMVWLPFIGLPPEPRNDGLRLLRYHDDQDALHLHAIIGKHDEIDDAGQVAERREREEALAESIRLAYVALTRARWSVRAFWAPRGRGFEEWGLSHLFEAGAAEASDAGKILERIAARCPQAIEHRALSEPIASNTLLAIAVAADRLQAAQAIARPPEHWRRHSFSALTRDHTLQIAESPAPAEDERDADDRVAEDIRPVIQWPGNAGPAGSAFGNALHALLERIPFADWRDADGRLRRPSPAEALLTAELRHQGIEPEREVNGAAALPLGLAVVEAGLLTPLPGAGSSLRLIDLQPASCIPELEFELRIRPCRGDDVLRCLQSHGYLEGVERFGHAAEHFEGLLHGFIDLVYRSGERFFVLDYKSNRLPDYGHDALAQAMREHRYDLQAQLYSLALHRWLRQRLGAAYDPARHFGGSVYLFLRGRLAATGEMLPDDSGLVFDRAPDALLHQLDALFDGETEAHGAAA